MIRRLLGAMALACALAGPALAEQLDDINLNTSGLYRPTVPTEALNPACPNAGAGGAIPGPGVVGKTYGGTVCPPAGGAPSISLGAFSPLAANNTLSLSASTTSSSVALGAATTTLVTNLGTVTADVAFGPSNVNATTSGVPIAAGATIAFANTGAYMAAITGGGTTTLAVTPGSGLPAVAGGPSGGGSGVTAQASSSAPTYTAGSNPLSLDLNGNLRVTDFNWGTLGSSYSISSGGTGGLGILEDIANASKSTATVPVACSILGSSALTPTNCNTSTPNATLTPSSVAAATVGSTASFTLPKAGEATVELTVSGETGTLPVLQVTATYDGTTFIPIYYALPGQTSAAASTFQGNGTYRFNVAAVQIVDVTVLTAGSAATVNITGAVSVAGRDVIVLNQPAAPVVATASAPVNVSTATTTQLVAPVSGKSIYVMSYDFIAAAAENVTLEYGSGTLCGTGTVALTGAYAIGANLGISASGGNGPKLFVLPGNALCVVSSAATQLSGSVSYAQQ